MGNNLETSFLNWPAEYTGKQTALTRGQRRSHSVSAPRFSAIKLDQTGIQ